MRPQRQSVIGDITQGEIELGMKIVESGGLRGLERGAVEENDRGQRPGRQANHRLGHVPDKRQVDVGFKLPGFDARLTHS